MNDPDSIFAYYQKLIRLRKEYEVIVYGSYDLLLEEDASIYAYTRTLDLEKLLVLCNFIGKEVGFTMPEAFQKEKKLLLCNYPASDETTLRAYEARVYLKG